jgi:hypothetical protein
MGLKGETRKYLHRLILCRRQPCHHGSKRGLSLAARQAPTLAARSVARATQARHSLHSRPSLPPATPAARLLTPSVAAQPRRPNRRSGAAPRCAKNFATAGIGTDLSATTRLDPSRGMLQTGSLAATRPKPNMIHGRVACSRALTWRIASLTLPPSSRAGQIAKAPSPLQA